MLEHSEKYILRCKEIGILTERELHKYPLREANLAVVLKAYAISTHSPYTISQKYEVLSHHKLYLTESGFEWLLSVFSKHTIGYLRSTFGFVFAKADPSDIKNHFYEGYRNFRGKTGKKPKAGSKQGAVLVRTYGPPKNKRVQEFTFDTLHEARKEVLRWTRFFPIEQFELYRIRKNTKNGKVSHYRSKVPLVLGENKRGAVVNLPNVRR